MTRFVTQRSLTRSHPSPHQWVALISRLVTHPGVFVPVSNTPDARPATAVSDPRSPALGNASGSPAWQTNAANSCVCAPSDTQVCRSTSGRADAEDLVGITRRSVCTYACACVSPWLSSSAYDPCTDHGRRRKSHTKKTGRRSEENDSNEVLRRKRRTRGTRISDRKLYPAFRTAVACRRVRRQIASERFH